MAGLAPCVGFCYGCGMSKPSSPHGLSAPGAASYAVSAPSAQSPRGVGGANGLRMPGMPDPSDPGRPWPRLDDHLVEPENEERAEIIDGHVVYCMAANPEHAAAQANLGAVLRVAAAPGYSGLVELLTRSAVDQNFAADACILRDGKDEKTGTRYLEDLAFEVVNEQSMSTATKKAERLSNRGVRRVFGLFVKEGKVKEWRGAWDLLTGPIVDACLRLPLYPKALLDGVEGELVMARALIQKKNPEIENYKAQGFKDGETQGFKDGAAQGFKDGETQALSRAILAFLSARGLAVSEDERARISTCDDIAILNHWISRAATVSAAADLFS